LCREPFGFEIAGDRDRDRKTGQRTTVSTAMKAKAVPAIVKGRTASNRLQ
jgi:hypothetical protein